MKNNKRPTLAQKKILEKNGLDSTKWYVVKNLPDALEVISAQAIKKGSTKTRTLSKI